MEEKVENMQARSEAYQEISIESGKDQLEGKFEELQNQSTDIDAELIELKKRAELPPRRPTQTSVTMLSLASSA